MRMSRSSISLRRPWIAFCGRRWMSWSWGIISLRKYDQRPDETSPHLFLQPLVLSRFWSHRPAPDRARRGSHSRLWVRGLSGDGATAAAKGVGSKAGARMDAGLEGIAQRRADFPGRRHNLPAPEIYGPGEQLPQLFSLFLPRWAADPAPRCG